MTEENYKKALSDAIRETDELLTKRNEIDRRLAQLKATVNVLSGLLEQPPKEEAGVTPEIEDLGISQAIRQILSSEATRIFAPGRIKAKLEEGGFDLAKYNNPSAVIHNTLKRLETQGEVTAVKVSTAGGGTYAYMITAKGRSEQITLKLAEIEKQFGKRQDR